MGILIRFVLGTDPPKPLCAARTVTAIAKLTSQAASSLPAYGIEPLRFCADSCGHIGPASTEIKTSIPSTSTHPAKLKLSINVFYWRTSLKILQHFSITDPTTNSRKVFTWLKGLTQSMAHHLIPSPRPRHHTRAEPHELSVPSATREGSSPTAKK